MHVLHAVWTDSGDRAVIGGLATRPALRRAAVVGVITLALATSGIEARGQSPSHETLRRSVALALSLLPKPRTMSFAPDRELGWTPIGYQEARKHLFLIRSTLVKELQADPASDALRAYIELNFPDFEPNDVQQFGWAPEGGVVSEDAYDAVLAKVTTFLKKLDNLSPIAIGLAFQTSPSGARVTIRPMLGSRSREVLSNGEFVNVYRGLYEYRIVKAGFETLVGELDLVDDSREAISCRLIPDGATDVEPGCMRTSRPPGL